MSPRYSYAIQEDGSYSFITDNNDLYLVYFYEQPLETDGNSFSTYSIGFSKNGGHDCEPFQSRYDSKIKATIISAVNDFFVKNDHRTLFYFCYDEDGYGRHRNIVFNQWGRGLEVAVERYADSIIYEGKCLYISMLILEDNALKQSILESFANYLKDLKNK